MTSKTKKNLVETDRGKQFLNKIFKDLLNENNNNR